MTIDQAIALQETTKGVESITQNLFRLSINQTDVQKTMIQAAQTRLECFVEDIEDITRAFK